MPAPATNIATISSASSGRAPSRTIGSPSAAMPSMPNSSGRCSGTRSSTTVISSSPADSADSTRPQPCSPIVSFATAGPRVKMAPMWMALRKPNASTTTHSQVVRRK